MSKYTAEQVREWKAIAESQAKLFATMKGAHEPWEFLADMLGDLYAHLAAQAEWPSDEDVERAHKAYWDTPEDHKGDDRDAMRAALTAVWHNRPAQENAEPVGMVSDDRHALLYLMQQFDSETWQCPSCGHSEDTATMDSAYYLREYLASRHAPTKD